jgi:tetratricopeptide (TPR) repeat protein
MADNDDKTRIQKLIQNQVNPDALRGLKIYKEVCPKFNDAIKKLTDAIRNSDMDMIRLYQGSIESDTKQIQEAMVWMEQAFQTIEMINKNPGDVDPAADFPELETLVKSMSAAKTTMVGLLKTGSQLDDSATKALAKEGGNEREAMAQWADLVGFQRSKAKAGPEILADFKSLLPKAKQAALARDSKALNKIKIDAANLVGAGDTQRFLEYLDMTLKSFDKKFDLKKMSKEFQEQVARDTATLKALGKDVEGSGKQIQNLYYEIDGVKLTSIDPNKAAKVLGIPPAGIPKLKKALELEDAAMIKALDALAKELNLKTTGKVMAEKLNKM